MPISRCSQGTAVAYLWAGKAADKTHIDAAVDALMAAITNPRRRWNPWNTAIAKAEFKARLRAAERGELEPVDEVKFMTSGKPRRIFEIRWHDITVHEAREDGQVDFLEVNVRAYHAEPAELPQSALGLHAHEKVVVPGGAEAVNEAQNREIQKAAQLFDEGRASKWGLG